MLQDRAGRDQVVVNDVGQRPGAAAPGERVILSALAGIESPRLGELLPRERDWRGDSDARRFREDTDAAVVVLIRPRRRKRVEDDRGRDPLLTTRDQFGGH